MSKRVEMQVSDKINDLFFDVEKEPLITLSGAKTDRFALVRKDSKAILGYCSEDYAIVPNKDVIGEVTEVLSKEQFLAKKVIQEKNGSRCYVEYESTINHEIQKSYQKNDILKARIVFYNSFNAQRCMGLMVGIYRLVCKNGAYRADQEFSFEYRHSAGVLNQALEGEKNSLVLKAKQAIGLLTEKYIPAYQAMATKKITMPTIQRLAEHLPSRLMEEVNGSNQLLGKTEWEGYNDFTYQLTHNFNGSFSRNIDIQRGMVKGFGLM